MPNTSGGMRDKHQTIEAIVMHFIRSYNWIGIAEFPEISPLHSTRMGGELVQIEPVVLAIEGDIASSLEPSGLL